MVIIKSNIKNQKTKNKNRGIKVKICGITNLGDALRCIDAGADALGFVFYKKSKRYISPEDARLIISKLPRRIIKVGVFVDEREKTVKKIARACKLDFIQLHGNETPEFCAKLDKYKVIKAFRVKDDARNMPLDKYAVSAYLFDTFSRRSPGGTGRVFDWRLLSKIKPGRPVILSGGLDIRNVRKAIRLVSPDWVDASSSLESSPGIKDRVKVRKFISLAKK